MKGVDLTRVDLIGAVLFDCDLLDAVFSNTQLRAADLTTAFNFTIDPERNLLKGLRISIHQAM